MVHHWVQTQVLAHSLVVRLPLVLLVLEVLVAVQTKFQLMRAVQEVFPAVERVVAARQSQAAQQEQVDQEGRAS
jgi:hypothetical protein